MNKERKNQIIIDRFIETIIAMVALSAITVVLDTLLEKVSLSYWGKMLLLLIMTVIFFAVVVSRCRWSFFEAGSYKLYLNINIMAYLMLVVVNILCAVVLRNDWGNIVYTWGFVITKLPKFLVGLYNSNVISAIAFHIIGVLVVAMAPLGVKIIPPEEAEMPPMLIIPEEKETGREDNKSET